MGSRNTIRIVAAIVCILLAAFTLYMMASPYDGVVVITDSMQPAIPKGSLAIVAPADPARIAIGDIVLFQAPEQAVSVLHRVAGMDGQAHAFMTKGDMNDQADLFPVPWEALEGRYAAHIPAVGYLVYYARQYALLLAFALLAGLLASLVATVRARHQDRP